MVDHRPLTPDRPFLAATALCSVCGDSLRPGLAFCGACGAIVNACQECDENLVAGDTSCPACGAIVDPKFITTPLPSQQTDDDSHIVWSGILDQLRSATLGEFEIVRPLGRGGMAAVFLARDNALDREVAIKVMSPLLAADDRMVARFRREARTGAGLKHPNIATVHRVLERGGLHFFVMDFVHGQSLESIINTTGRLPIHIAQALIHQVGAGLSYAHRRGVYHRDVKPGNILVSAIDGTAIVTDFGIAKISQSPNQTQTGAVVGTPFYMPPEQVLGRTVTPAADQYSLGIVFYEMLTGTPPFIGTTYLVMHAHARKAPRPVHERRPDCPKDVSDALARMLSKDPAQRWPTLSEAIAALGASPVLDDDPLRHELARLATPRSLESEVIALRATKRSTQTRTQPLDAAAVASITGMSALPVEEVPATQPDLQPASTQTTTSSRRRWRVARVALAAAALIVAGRAVLASLAPFVAKTANSPSTATTTATPKTIVQQANLTGGSQKGDGKATVDSVQPSLRANSERKEEAPSSAAATKSAASAPLRISIVKPEPIRVGESTTLRTKLANAPTGTTLPIMWESSHPSVARVDAFTGTVLAKGEGETTITARVAGHDAHTQVALVVLPATGSQIGSSSPTSDQPKHAPQSAPDDRKVADVLLESANALARAMRAHDRAALNQLLGGTAPDNLVDEVGKPEFAVGDVQTGSVDVNGEHASSQYTIDITYLTPVGTSRARALVFQAAAQKSTDGWRVERVRLESGWR